MLYHTFAINSILEIIKDHRDGYRTNEKKITPYVKDNVAEVINKIAAILLTAPEQRHPEKNIARHKILLLEAAFQAFKKKRHQIFTRSNYTYALSWFFTPRARNEAVSGTEQKHIKILKELHLAALQQFVQCGNLDAQDFEFLETTKKSELLSYHRSYYRMFCSGETRSRQKAVALIEKRQRRILRR